MDLTAFYERAALLDRSDRSKLHFVGEQAKWFCDQLLTNQVEELAAGDGVEALLLTPKGRITALMRLVATENSVFADTDPGQAAGLREFFDGRVFATKVEIRDRTGDFGILTVLGPRADEVVGAALQEVAGSEGREQRDIGMALPGDTEHHATHFGSTVAVRVARPVAGLDLWVKAEIVSQTQAALLAGGAEPLAPDLFEQLCALEGLPRFGVDFDDGYLPQEAALERAVRFDKGCYLGQEAVAMAQRGQVKRRLRRVRFDADPTTGPVFVAGTEVGRVSSAAAGPPGAFGIATIKTSVPLGAEGEVGEGTAVRCEILELPGTVEGPSVPSARELRERLQGESPRR